MNILRFLLFLSVALSVYFGMHYYVYRNLSALTSQWVWFKAVYFLLMLSFPLVQIISHKYPMIAGIWSHRLAALWLGFIFLLCMWFFFSNITLFFWSLIPGVPIPQPRTLSLIVTGAVALMCMWGLYNGLKIPSMANYTVDTSSRHQNSRTLRIVQLSDMHLGSALGESFLSDVVKRTMAIKPDLILITGDLVDRDSRNIVSMVPQLKQLKAPSGVYAVTGNHEYYSGLRAFLDLMKQAEISVLQNQLVTLPAGVQLAGVNDRTARQFDGENADQLAQTLNNYDPESPCILMSHQPKGLTLAVEKGVDLIFSGHTHSGQIFPFHFLVRMAFKYIRGLNKLSSRTSLIVSNGTGFWGPPLRILAPAQIVVVEFKY